MVAGFGPRVGVVEKHLLDHPVRQHIKQLAHVARMQRQIGDARRADLAQQHCNAVDKGLGADQVNLRMQGGHVNQMLTAAKTNLQPDRLALRKGQIQRRAAGVVGRRHTLQRQGAKVFGQITLLAGPQGLAMGAAIEIAAFGLGICVGHAGLHEAPRPSGHGRARQAAASIRPAVP